MNETSIGIEIEVNRMTEELRGSMDSSIWTRADEHCGVELRSVPCLGPYQIRRLIKSVAAMHKADKDHCGYDNAGTHIHIDFIPTPKVENPRKVEDLKKIDTSKPEVWRCDQCNLIHEQPVINPFGEKATYYYIDSANQNWREPGDYIRAWRPEKPKPNQIYASKRKHDDILTSVKRFLILGKRFSNILYGIQGPERRVNKYCHTIQYWDEKALAECESISDICTSPKLLNNHRRTMINPLSFSKYGTIEVRMIGASLDPQELWTQIFFFVRLARLAKSTMPIPESTGRLAVDFLNLMNAAGIHGKIRKRLLKLLEDRAHLKPVMRCFFCNTIRSNCVDLGLSRPICHDCNEATLMCDFCGHRHPRSRDHGGHYAEYDKKGPMGIRYSCRFCHDAIQKAEFEKKHGGLHIAGTYVPNGFDESGKPLWRV